MTPLLTQAARPRVADWLARVKARQEKVGYGDYARWIKAARPPEFV